MKKTISIFISGMIRSELMRNASVLITGTILAQLISILFQPLIRRLFNPADFGVYSVYLSIVGILVILSTFRYDDAIVLPKSDKESVNLLFLALIINIAVNSLIIISVLFWKDHLISFFNIPSGFPTLTFLVIPIGALLFNCFNVLNSWLIRKKKYISVSTNKLVRRGSETTAQIGFSFSSFSNGLILSDIAGQFANIITALVQCLKNGLDFKMVSSSKLLYVIKKHSDFPKYNLVPSLMSTCSYLLPPIFINKYYSSENAGLFDLSKLVLSIPLALVASSLSSVLLQKISEKYNKKESFIEDIKPVIIVVGTISIFEIAAILFFGEELFSFVFGQKWAESGKISRIMVWSFGLSFIVSTFSSLFYSMKKIRIYSIWQAFYFLCILSLILYRNSDFIDFLKLYVLIDVSCLIIMGLLLSVLIITYESNLQKSFKQ